MSCIHNTCKLLYDLYIMWHNCVWVCDGCCWWIWIYRTNRYMRIHMYIARLYVTSLWILMLQLNLIVVLYNSFDGRWSMYVYHFTILYAIKRIYVIHESYANRWLQWVLMFLHDWKTTLCNDCTHWALAHLLVREVALQLGYQTGKSGEDREGRWKQVFV